ncbi:membrane protein [Sulfurifustis variabilis]|uniref:Membrane protein n=1 Tax=Sulfurifustis variabilis TaxID=1675686 RepID=A0A1B4V0J2_9GAMM|nr:DUF1269 domain-containing protein [Sulfurifustis variabilis]BAU46969.1 membrane protein [Sulfurifustis variabilis]
MRRRMYFLLPDVKRARAVFKELLLARIEERHIKVMAREGTQLGDLPEAAILEKTDALHGAGLGLIVGGATGAVVGFLVMTFQPAGLDLGFAVVLALALLGAVMGAWASGMIGTSTPNTHLERFKDEIARGKVLMIVDVPGGRADEVSHAIKKHHPDADMRGFDATIPRPFP